MDDPSYLLSPVQTLSDRAQLHDLADAYATFVTRVRAQSDLVRTLSPALAPVQEHNVHLVHALRRDVRLAFDVHVTRQHARDASVLCHHALCALSVILRFPAFHSLFSDRHLSLLFGDVLDIALADRLPAFNSAKTRSLSLWILSSHRLPASILIPRRDDVFSALRHSLDHTHPPHVVLNGIKSISHLVQHHPSQFLHLLFPLIPNLVAVLLSDSSRSHASITLGKFANALISHPNLSLSDWQILSNHVISFLESHSDDSDFQSVIRTAFSAESHETPTWILAVLASLIILCGPTLYGNPRALCFIVHSLSTALTHKRAIIRALYPHVWRCLVWTFARMLFSPDGPEPSQISAALHTIKREVCGGIGTTLASVLLSDQAGPCERADRVAQALSVIQAMVQSECKHTRREAFMFLKAFSDDAQARHQIVQNLHEMPASILFDGTVVGIEWDRLPSAIHSIPKIPVVVRWIDESEIAHHYCALMMVWKHCAIEESDSSLVDVWSAILLTCSNQLGHASDVLNLFAEMMIEFLPSALLQDARPDWGSWSVSDQFCRLAFIDRLWSAMRSAFVVTSLAETAELFLASILKYAFHIFDLGVRTLWGRLCADLMITASPSFPRDTPDPTASQSVIRGRRELWGTVAASLSSSHLGLGWRELVKFLAIPIGSWVLSDRELEVWDSLFRGMIVASGNPANETAVPEMLRYLRGGVENWESVIPVLRFLLTSAECDVFPTDGILSLLDVSLIASYGRARHSPKTLSRSLELLDAIRSLIATHADKVMRILCALCDGLCIWIEDHSEVMSDDEFNSVAAPLYCETLKALGVLPLSIQSLQQMEKFLVSAFSRIPVPAIAPFAFERFWRATYHGHSQFCHALPPKIKSCLACFTAAYGGDLADNLSLTTESQSTHDSSQGVFSVSHRHQEPTGVGPEIFYTNATPPKKASSLDDVVPLTVTREYSSHVDVSSAGLKHPTNGSRTRFPTIPVTSDMVQIFCPPRKSHLAIAYASNQKRRLAPDDDVPRKRSRISRDILRTVRKSESEPASRDVTPVDVPRRSSVPLDKRMIFDGVQVPTLRTVLRHQSAGPNSRGESPSGRCVESDKDELDWEDFRVDVASSEIDVDELVIEARSCSSPPIQGSMHSSPQTCSTRLPDDDPRLASESGLSEMLSQVEITPSASHLQRTRATSARLDALQDVYSCVANGGSQIPLSELVRATRLVHQIGAVLTEQMGKKMGDPR